jgi:hypothetical protein
MTYFNDRAAMARNAIDLDISDSARALLDGRVDLDDRGAVEQVIIAPDCYRDNPETFRRFVDECIATAKYRQNKLLEVYQAVQEEPFFKWVTAQDNVPIEVQAEIEEIFQWHLRSLKEAEAAEIFA